MCSHITKISLNINTLIFFIFSLAKIRVKLHMLRIIFSSDLKGI